MRHLAAVVVLGVLAGPTSADDLPDVKSKAVVVLDAKTGAEIFSKAADDVRPIASTTKIFVAMVVRKHNLDLGGWTEINRVDAKEAAGGARTRLDVGEKFRNQDLLRAMLMASDNRAPTALGRAAGMDPDELVTAMNKLAKELGLAHTKFTSPSGLHGNVSTAREMAIALTAALGDRVLREIMGDEFETVVSKRHSKIGYGTTNAPLVAKKYDVVGGKTGYTKPAGYCFITGARIDSREVVMAFLGADAKQTRFADFNRVAAWLDRGAPGSKLAAKLDPKRPKTAPAKHEIEAHGRVAHKAAEPAEPAEPANDPAKPGPSIEP
ncbi:MAG: peptidase D-alanyl-D-alanine carboxypeptidase 1 [Deltaproteobacteria bacterium]|nr:peptidase D-alanyl-D-alanine carboxypeptidase 1 [Deltaproteobacteria bacterium]